MSPTEVDTQSLQAEQPVPSESQSETQNESQDEIVVPTITPEASRLDPAAIEAAWRSSPHANAFVQDSAGQNNTCAQCHAPINWQPSMDTLPESCFACKFELEDPPAFIPESAWLNIPCNVCHKVDKKDNILPEYAWLEIAPLGEYTAVASPTELCLKCHAPIDIPKHGYIDLINAHAAYQCTDCHSAHDTNPTSCDAVDCHPEIIKPASPIPGHDTDHQMVSCVACHDGGSMEVGPGEDAGIWTTFTTTGTAETGVDRFAFTSHNVVLESNCDRCHFVDNPWGLSVVAVEP